MTIKSYMTMNSGWRFKKTDLIRLIQLRNTINGGTQGWHIPLNPGCKAITTDWNWCKFGVGSVPSEKTLYMGALHTCPGGFTIRLEYPGFIQVQRTPIGFHQRGTLMNEPFFSPESSAGIRRQPGQHDPARRGRLRPVRDVIEGLGWIRKCAGPRKGSSFTRI